MPSRRSRAPKRPRSSARSIASTGVPSSGTPGLLERARQLQRRLAAELDDHALGLLLLADREHVLGRQRLEVEAVGGVVVGRDRLRVAVDHHRVAAELARGHRRVHAAVVELDPLADPVRAGAEDDDRVALAAADLRGGGAVGPRALVGRVVVGRRRLELGGAGVDRLVGAGEALGAVALGGQRLAARAGTSGRPGSARAPPRRRGRGGRPRGSGRSARRRASRARSSSSSSAAGSSALGSRARASASPWRRTRGRCGRSPSPRRRSACGSRARPRRRGTSRRRSAGSW